MIEWIGEGDLLPGYCVEIPVGRKGTNLLSDRGTVWAAMYTYHGKDCPGATYLVVNRTYYQSQLGYLVSVDGQIPCVKAQMRATGAKGGLTYEVSVPPGTQAFRPCAATPVVGRKAPTKWELVYSGRSGDEIQLSYREYDDYGIAQVARPAFYQDLQYDLGKGSRITFRNTMIEVLDANNSGITFKVVAH